MSDNPEPFRSPLGWFKPVCDQENSENVLVQVSIPNEDPDTEDDLTIQVRFTGEGIIVDLLVSGGEPVATFGQMYDEFVGTIHDLDPMTRPPVDSATQRVAALSADLRLRREKGDEDDTIDALLDAIDAMLSEG